MDRRTLPRSRYPSGVAALDDRWLSVDEVAEYLGVSKDTVYAWVTHKGMPGYKVGRFWKFKREAGSSSSPRHSAPSNLWSASQMNHEPNHRIMYIAAPVATL
jgi:excisionase family DNA binding protein